MRLPDLPDVQAAWTSLPPETRDRIGVIAIDMVLQGFIYGDAYVATGRPEDRAVQDAALCDAAGAACDRRLNELHAFVEAVLPCLFGPAGENPAWSENAGARP